MFDARSVLTRILPLLLVAAAMFVIDVGDAYAQSASCRQLQRQLQSLERNSDFRQGGNTSQAAKRAASQVQQDESAYVRTGCNDLAKQGAQLPRECRNLARRILDGRAQVEQLNSSVSTATAVGQQREAILQEIARFGCNSGSQASVTNDQRPRRKTLFEELFGGYTQEEQTFGDGGEFIEDGTGGYGAYGTIRTVCVRKSDGYFWPISYSTIQDYVNYDAQQCAASCPGTPVELYYYNNPGQEAEDMVSVTGERYASQSYAFAYRKAFDESARCQVAATGGSISVVTSDSGQSTAMITYGEQSFPMPRRDPRAASAVETLPVQQVATAVGIPLPRPRPRQAGEVGPLQSVAAKPSAPAVNRTVVIGGKSVRIVGPDTPYARLGAAAT